MKKWIVMEKFVTGSEDGRKVKAFEKGQSYEVDERLARVFVEEMEVAHYKDQKKAEVPQNKMTAPGRNKKA